MQPRFHEWLDAELQARGWQAADLARAAIDESHPRGFDPGLISRWRKPPPLGVVPTRPTLDRLAQAFRIPRAVPYRAAGLQAPEDDQSLAAELDPDLAVVAATWSSLDDGIRRAIRILAGSQPPITGRGRGGITGQSRPGSRDKDGHTRRLTDEKRHLVAAAA